MQRLLDVLRAHGNELFVGVNAANAVTAATAFAGLMVADHAKSLGMSCDDAQEMAAGLITGAVIHHYTWAPSFWESIEPTVN